MQKLKRFAFGVLAGANAIAACYRYEDLYTTILSLLPTTKAAGFHAKNIANLLEHRLFGLPWHSACESEQNGVGPGCHYFAHMRHGHGKKIGVLGELAVAADVSEQMTRLRSVWPWKSQIRFRHVQSLFCDLQKFVQGARRGYPLTTCSRKRSVITTIGMQRLANSKRRKDVC